jgi:hypothetical protein
MGTKDTLANARYSHRHARRLHCESKRTFWCVAFSCARRYQTASTERCTTCLQCASAARLLACHCTTSFQPPYASSLCRRCCRPDTSDSCLRSRALRAAAVRHALNAADTVAASSRPARASAAATQSAASATACRQQPKAVVRCRFCQRAATVVAAALCRLRWATNESQAPKAAAVCKLRQRPAMVCTAALWKCLTCASTHTPTLCT